MGVQLLEVPRCPHCSIASPMLVRMWSSDGEVSGTNGEKGKYWGTYACRSCGGAVTANATWTPNNRFVVGDMFPAPKTAHEDIPEPARTFLQQAYDVLHAADAAAVMAGSAVDAMLKEHKYIDGSLYSRIDQALADNRLTKGMSEWAHSVRLGSNRPRHADKETPHVSPHEAKQSVEFAEALGNFLFVLTARINRGVKAAKALEPAEAVTSGASPA